MSQKQTLTFKGMYIEQVFLRLSTEETFLAFIVKLQNYKVVN